MFSIPVPRGGARGESSDDALFGRAFSPERPLGEQVPKRAVVSAHGKSATVYRTTPGRGGLELTDDEVLELNAVVKNAKLTAIRRTFDKQAAALGSPPFDVIPTSCQTALACFCCQHGENVGLLKSASDRRRRLWDCAVRSDWSGVIEILIGEFLVPKEKAFEERRREEITLFMRGMGQQTMGPRLQRMFLKHVTTVSSTA